MFEVAARVNNVQYNASHSIASPVSSGAQPSATALTTSRPLNNAVSSATSVYEIIVLFISALAWASLGPSLLFL